MSREEAVGGPPHYPQGLVNFRDLGGLPAAGGRRVRAGLVYRSESLAGLAAADVELLCADLGVGNVIDLRAVMEVESARPACADRPGMRYVNLPLSDGFAEVPADLSEAELKSLVARKYGGYLTAAGQNIRLALESIAEAATAGIPSVFNCTYGKDRTGVLAAVLLELLEVERAAIVEDYAATAAAMPVLMERMSSDPMHGPRLRSVPRQVYLAERRSLEDFLANLDRDGGAVAWALESGLPAGTLGRLRSSLLEAG